MGKAEMDEALLRQIWELMSGQKRCNGCPLKGLRHPLIFKPKRPLNVKIMVITEGPNRVESKSSIASIANHPTYTYLFTLFKGKFIPEGPAATAYWTHLRKCFLKNKRSKPLTGGDQLEIEKRALDKCRKNYLIDEIKAAQPKLIVAVGKETKDFLYRISHDRRLKGDELEVLERQTEGLLERVAVVDGLSLDVCVVPHPSGLSRFWNKVKKKHHRRLEEVQSRIAAAL